MAHLRAAAANGYQLFLALIIKGPPGCGKSMFVDAFKTALEGQIVYSVEGCPVHENPLNLLTLLSDKTLDKIAERLHLTAKDSEELGTPTLKELLAVAGKPCQHCWSMVMEHKCEKDPNKALLNLKVIPQRLSTRKYGISTWTPNSPLTLALERGSRGMTDMGELFDGAGSPMLGGTSPQLKILLDATNDRKIPGSGSGSDKGLPKQLKEAAKAVLPAAAAAAVGAEEDDCEDDGNHPVTGNSYVPLDTVLFGQANEGAWQQFLKSLGKDAAKFTRRFYVKTYPYNTSVTEEEMAYHDRIGLMREVPHFDPIALKLLSLLAVISRLKTEGDIDVVSRARIYDGEKLEVKRSSTTTSGPFGGILAAATGAGGPTANHPDYWTVEDLWRQAGDTEAQTGLDMTVMFNMLSELIDRALKEKKFEGCVSSYEMLTFLRNRLTELEKSDGFTEEQREVLKKCRKDFLMEAPKGSKPGQIESEYRRLLIRQLYELAAPDFERRAEELYQRYKVHANAFAVGDKTVEEPDANRKGRTNKVKIDEVFLDELDNWIGLKTSSDRSTFRQGLNAEIFKFVRERRVKLNLADDEELKASGDINWKTLPRLADGIRRKLNSETRVRLERLLKSPLELQDETEDDRRLRAEVFKQFDKLGYCEHCRSQALEYFKLNELWQAQS